MVTYVFDASALLAYLLDTPGGPKVGDLLKEAQHGRAEILMSAVNFGEAYGFVLRGQGADRARASYEHGVSIADAIHGCYRPAVLSCR